MIEKQETDDFEDPDDALEGDGDPEDLARLARELDQVRKRGTRHDGVPAWRKLELLAEQRRVAELTSDFDDYDIGEPKAGRRRTFL